MFEYNNIISATRGAAYAHQHGGTYCQMMKAAIGEWYYGYASAFGDNPEDDEIVDALYERHGILCYEVDKRF